MPVMLLTLAQNVEPEAGRSVVVDLLLLLAASGAVTMVLRRFDLSTIPGYLITGALIGPSALGLVTSPDNIQSISDLAILLLMFTIGLHLDLGAIRAGMVSIIAVGIASTAAVALALWPVGMAFGLSAPAALTVGMAYAMSSTAVVLGILQSRRELHRVYGRLCIGISIMQDLLAVVVLALLPPIALWAGARAAGLEAQLTESAEVGRVGALLIGAALAVGGIAAMVAFGKYLLPRLLREATRGGGAAGAEELLIVSSAVALAAAVLTYYAGIGSALGAFLAGFLLASTPFRHQLSGQLAPLRGLFMAVFFTLVGLRMDFGVIVHQWWIVGLGVAALLAVKSAIISLACWAGGATAPAALMTGCLLAQAGEFSLVVLAAAGSGDAGRAIIPAQAEPTLIAIVVVSLVLATSMRSLAVALGPRVAAIRPAAWIRSPALREPHEHGAHAAGPGGPASTGPAPPPGRGHVIIAGFGIVGRAIADRFEVAGIPFIVVELNPSTVRRQSALGRPTIYGDICNPEVLESARVREADAVMLTIPDDDAVVRACHAIRAMNPRAFIAVRTSYLSSAFVASGAGADDVTVAEVATAEAMAKQVIRRLTERRADPATAAPAAADSAVSTSP
jgi:CPA2 family monovalent cation:H+ antiporter-2